MSYPCCEVHARLKNEFEKGMYASYMSLLNNEN